MQNHFDAILFDFDGVLADTEPIHCRCWAEVLRPLGIQLDWPSFEKEFVGIPDPQVVESLCSRNDPPVDFALAWARHEQKQQLFRARLLEAPPIPLPVIELIRSLAASGYGLGLVTASARSEIEPVIERAGIRAPFQAAVYREDVERSKPAPDPYLRAARLLDAVRPLVVEDSEAGLASGRAAGFEVVRVAGPSDVPGKVRARLLLSNDGGTQCVKNG